MPLATLPPTTSRSSSRQGRPRHRRSVTLPTRFPNIVPRSTLISPIISDLNPTTRINVLHPPSVPRRTVSLETRESQYHMQRRCALMQQREWARQHGEWQKAMYGTAAVREDYRSNIRSTLKSQIDDRKRSREIAWLNAIQESIMMSERDYQDRLTDANRRREKFNFLFAFTRANKEFREHVVRAISGDQSGAVCLVDGGATSLHSVFTISSTWTAKFSLPDLGWVCDVILDNHFTLHCPNEEELNNTSHLHRDDGAKMENKERRKNKRKQKRRRTIDV